MDCPTIETVEMIVEAAEREGGVCKLDMCCNKRRFRDCVTDYSDLTGKTMLWYNDIANSTHVITRKVAS